MKKLQFSTFTLALLAMSAEATPWMDTQDNYLDQSPLLPEGADKVAAATTWEYRF